LFTLLYPELYSLVTLSWISIAGYYFFSAGEGVNKLFLFDM